jgi:enoyl-CoA hydratase
MMSEPVLRVDKDPSGYAVVTLNRPHVANALSRELRAAFAEAFVALEADPDVRVVILTGAGKAFCAGLDIKEISESSDSFAGPVAADPAAAMAAFSGPIIGAVNGAAVTGGFEIALACDVLIASTSARFADTHARVGVMPGWGLSQRLSRAIGLYRAREMSFSGNYVSAAQANEWGFVNRVVAPDDLLPQARALASDMLEVLPHMLVAMKKVIDEGFGMNFADAMKHERAVSRAANAQVRGDSLKDRNAGIFARGRAQTK